jgi:hypothetical protein
MRRVILALLFPAFLGTLSAQNQPPRAAGGLDTEWDIGVILGEISAHAGRLLPALERVDAKGWIAKGASETYSEQLDSCKRQAEAIRGGALELARNPERLPEALELFFRIQGTEAIIASLDEGIRRYQSPADAQTLAAVAAENGVNRDRLRSYVVGLAAERERQIGMLDREAQRCRSMTISQPPAARAGTVKKK